MREDYFDSLKAVAIIAVLVIHAGNFGLSRDGQNYAFSLALRQIIVFAVPAFFFASGYLGARRASEEPPVSYALSRCWRLIPPYLVWSFICTALIAPEVFLSPATMVKRLITGESIFVGYFVIVLLQMTALAPVIARLKSVGLHIAMMVVLTAAGVFFTYGTKMATEVPWYGRYPISFLPFFVWYPFFHLGIMAKLRGWTGDPGLPRARWMATGLWIALVLLSFAEAMALDRLGVALAASQLKISSLAASLAFIAAFLAWSIHGKLSVPPPLTWLGGASFFVYLSHMLIYQILEPRLQGVGMIANFQPLYVLVLSLTTLTVLCAVIWLARKVMPVRWHPYVGL